MGDLTIKLRGKRPVKIHTDVWPIIAAASHCHWDGEHRVQANRTWMADVAVRARSDGLKIVYGTASYRTCWQGERSADAWSGYRLAATATEEDLISTIVQVCHDLTEIGDIPDLSAEVLADLDPEEV